jgi:hypothetical protein
MIVIGLFLLALGGAAIALGALNPRLRMLAAVGAGGVTYLCSVVVWSVLVSSGIVSVRSSLGGTPDRLTVDQVRVLMLVPPTVPAILIGVIIARSRAK